MYVEEIVPVFTGEDKDIRGLQLRQFLAKPKRDKWIWTSPSYLDQPPRPESEYVWAWIMEDAKIGEFYEVSDTNFIREFEYVKIQVATLEKESHKEWVEVLCENQMTDDFIIKLKKALVDKGYGHKLKMNSKVSEETYKALAYFQVNHELPIGNLDFETLKYLGVDYYY